MIFVTTNAGIDLGTEALQELRVLFQFYGETAFRKVIKNMRVSLAKNSIAIHSCIGGTQIEIFISRSFFVHSERVDGSEVEEVVFYKLQAIDAALGTYSTGTVEGSVSRASLEMGALKATHDEKDQDRMFSKCVDPIRRVFCGAKSG
ncbi:Hypothetical Protein FCC1311_069522 [Hondaea fermentalgiana]|uniref:Uncharacterized protein n=1 Tax=Hondaea fermentalgiana TaxID=2315210 RepID=A0A2R5GIL5_9STRA|nr:Hypothetical Protein FCC1311_069522 [Hondaea fermentalgiana]|eukprot:GBG30732.1 Hypothetical Protein FCC1311_069522 [Hondaea fermentalgiana]